MAYILRMQGPEMGTPRQQDAGRGLVCKKAGLMSVKLRQERNVHGTDLSVCGRKTKEQRANAMIILQVCMYGNRNRGAQNR